MLCWRSIAKATKAYYYEPSVSEIFSKIEEIKCEIYFALLDY